MELKGQELTGTRPVFSPAYVVKCFYLIKVNTRRWGKYCPSDLWLMSRRGIWRDSEVSERDLKRLWGIWERYEETLRNLRGIWGDLEASRRDLTRLWGISEDLRRLWGISEGDLRRLWGISERFEETLRHLREIWGDSSETKPEKVTQFTSYLLSTCHFLNL